MYVAIGCRDHKGVADGGPVDVVRIETVGLWNWFGHLLLARFATAKPVAWPRVVRCHAKWSDCMSFNHSNRVLAVFDHT